MKLTSNGDHGGATTEDSRTGDGGGGRKKVLVGVKLDPRSRELLTWSLVKVAEPGDVVIALHGVDTGLSLSLLSSLSLVSLVSGTF